MRVQVNAPNVATRRVSQGGLAASLNRGWATSLPGASGPILRLVALEGQAHFGCGDSAERTGGAVVVEAEGDEAA